MVVRVYVSGISGNKEVKKRQQRVTMILESKNIKYNVIDIAEPGNENEKEFMQENSKAKDSKHPLPPQIFNDDNYCGDYEEFDMANELDELENFLKLSSNEVHTNLVENGITNGSKVDIVKDSFKDEIHESTEETLNVVNNDGVEAVSLDNEVHDVSNGISSDPDENLHPPDEIPNTLDDIPNDPDEIPNALNEHEGLKENENGLAQDNEDVSNVAANEE